MRGKTFLASFVTITFMLGFVFATFAGVAIASSQESVIIGTAIGFAVTVAWAAFTWILSPFFMDFMLRFFYSAKTVTIEDLDRDRPQVAGFVRHVCGKHKIRIPTLKLIFDETPQAFCYGAYANNARLVTTVGLGTYLDDEELKAVYAHELGHIVHRDFIVMTVAATLLNILWNTYVIARNIRGKNG
ncbi:MAG: M48 family metalloprotease, partial [Polyangiaceae bacterium]